MDVTHSEEAFVATGNGKTPATDSDGAGEGSQVARAREDDGTPIPGWLPNAESVRAWRDTSKEHLRTIFSGEVVRIQPPHLQELAERVIEGPWANSESSALRFLAKAGLLISVAWSTVFYTVAVLGQRPGRAITALITYVLFINLL